MKLLLNIFNNTRNIAMMAGVPSGESIKLLQNISKDVFHEKLKNLGIPLNRITIFYKIITREQCISYPESWDLQRYALKIFFAKEYAEMSLGNHCYSSGDLFEYDPPKNGANIIKHGVSFSEVISYSVNFGSLVVACPDEKDKERLVIFSELNLAKFKLELPLDSFCDEAELYVLSIVSSRYPVFRFISSRILSKKRYKEIINQSLKNIYKNDSRSRSAFVNRSIEIVENNLLKKFC